MDAAERDAMEKSWLVLNLQADTMLKVSRHRTEFWKIVVAGMTAGAALFVAGAAFVHNFH